jgi:hypothetical protein
MKDTEKDNPTQKITYVHSEHVELAALFSILQKAIIESENFQR